MSGINEGNPTGLLIANPNASILYSSLGKAPTLNFDDQINSTRHFMRELNRLVLQVLLTQVVDSKIILMITKLLNI